MDVFIEQLVERKKDSRDTVLRICIILAATSLSFLIVMFAIWITYLPLVIIVGGVIWLAMFILKGLTVEYEYILTNRDLDIDKIIGKRKRKRLVSLNLINAEEFDLYHADFDSVTDVTVSAHDNSYTGLWYLVGKHPAHGKVILLFSPNDEFAITVNNALPSKAKNKKVTELSRQSDEKDD
ncbi:MAG: hypothetical protein FWD34_10075 [Oscillospiraceae bacterium]|nr:hypothetical protein [Oscillospiraceae bacterium]